ncbi:uncharacterized protein V6R79_014605 [Siganus canaliculatus]
MQFVIRRYRPSDEDSALMLFSSCTREQIWPCFHDAITSPLYIITTLALCLAGFLLGSVLGAVVLPGSWVGLIYYCCYELYAGFVENELQTDMYDIPGNYLSRPDDCFWVAEVVVDGRARIVGTVAVVSKQCEKESYGELVRMMVSPLCRRMGLGVQMCQTVINFCKERGFSKVVLETGSTQTAAVALYRKMGFSYIITDAETEPSSWKISLTRARLIKMKKYLK